MAENPYEVRPIETTHSSVRGEAQADWRRVWLLLSVGCLFLQFAVLIPPHVGSAHQGLLTVAAWGFWTLPVMGILAATNTYAQHVRPLMLSHMLAMVIPLITDGMFG